MRRYYGNEKVRAGLYWTPARWEIVTIGREGGVLPEGGTYVRLPATIMMLLGTLLGGLYVIFLPFIGFVMFFGFAGKKLWHLLAKAWNAALPAADNARK